MRGRVVRFPPAPGLRPTPDRVRETLFNWLGQRLDGKRCLEPYGGTGVLSLEALSRGAILAVVIERQRQLADALRATAETFGATGLEVRCDDARSWLLRETRSFDVIFLDPPFAEDPWEWLLPACTARLAPEGRLYVEARREVVPGPDLELLRHDTAGQVHYHLLARGP